MANIYDVATQAGVSPSTVSRVFNGVSVSPEKERLVRDAALALGFMPNQAARALRTQRTDVITLIVADIENPFFTALARGVEDVASGARYSVVLCNSDEDLSKEATYLDIAEYQQVAGVIMAPASEFSDVSRVMRGGRPVVSVDRALRSGNVDTVMVDSRARGRKSTEFLLADGYRKIACITGPEHNETAEDRARGWQDAVREHGLDLPPSRWLVHSNNKFDGGLESIRALLDGDDQPDAVFVANNLMGLGVLHGLQEAGIAPVDFGVATSGDFRALTPVPEGVHVIPMPAHQIGETAARILLERINGDTQPPRTVVLRS